MDVDDNKYKLYVGNIYLSIPYDFQNYSTTELALLLMVQLVKIGKKYIVSIDDLKLASKSKSIISSSSSNVNFYLDPIKIPSSISLKNDMLEYWIGRIAERLHGKDFRGSNIKTLQSSAFDVLELKAYELDDGQAASSIPQWKYDLVNNGIAVVKIPDFDPSKYCTEFFKFLFSYGLQASSNIPVSDWDTSTLPTDVDKGMFKSTGIHQEWLWEIREKCYPVFQSIWGDNDLVSSFDGFSFMKPDKQSKGDNKQTWFHTDQYRKHGNIMKIIQGVVCLTDVRDIDPGFVFLPGSVNLYQKHLECYPSSGFTFETIDLNRHDIYRYLRPVKLIVKAGSIILFDSRLIHGTVNGLYTNENVQPSFRMVSYVCMTPSRLLTNVEREKRREWYHKKCGTNHWTYTDQMHRENKPFRHKNYATISIDNDPETKPLHELSGFRRMLIG